MTKNDTVRVCAAHVAPVFLDAKATTSKICSLIAEASRDGADLIAFPEAMLPGFPVWVALQAPINSHDFFKRMVAQSVAPGGPEVAQIREAAKKHEIFVSLGISETSPASVGCIWNSNLLINDHGDIISHHRKLVPTFYEKLVWANGDGAGLKVAPTRIGKIGMLICGENTNPLAKYSLIAQGEQLHISSYPPIWPTRRTGEAGAYNLENAIRIRAGAHSFEGKVFNVVASACVDKTLEKFVDAMGKDAKGILEDTPRAVSMILGPTGDVISDTLCEDEGLLHKEVDLKDCVEPKQFHDVSGYYNRYDVFEFSLNTRRQEPMTINEPRRDPNVLEQKSDRVHTEAIQPKGRP
ncbi:carbon-nitrogen hydrolase family protein [Pseudohalocynthiibacter sp. F2068]|uniref:carbon-nitrogen hydrolase family protein n=1 Tax=Pseudohalocynthiibacter sp. F2068 TaxID=2926418 RepID=UPI001FF4E904|nr:carbon-nitrogen hydrolase family protein [Pseudohalocynthiibacter sp. F2068]MCK0104587.1 carbon-nitrogen hydrolase family protein [Pseudohalocynthiibacter sp. F2068]